MPKRKYTMAERASMGEESSKRKSGAGSAREDRDFRFYEESSSGEIFETRGRPRGSNGKSGDDFLSWVLAAGVVLLAIAIFTM